MLMVKRCTLGNCHEHHLSSRREGWKAVRVEKEEKVNEGRAALHRIDLARSLFVACTQVSTSSGHGESRNLRTARDLLTSGLEHLKP
ncbi:hypothetical protein C0Q70_12149 [Pomacea canaliculata]|uniref:Uncharacterized protein n=1 Tax=Pomacea canaliculata TaxID=400727 RepID=A0A2T7P0Q0_POMCA|nr:hypothetical protein C0Q70_12149 [Pomacea canaliculata]